MSEGSIITINGIPNIGKQFYSQVINNYLKKKQGEETLKKFSFPSFTTHRGQKVLDAIKKFKAKDLDLDNCDSYTKLRYKRVIEALLANYQEYQKYIDMHLFHPENIAIINNNYYSILAHGLAVQLEYAELQELIAPFMSNRKTLSIFLSTQKLPQQGYNHYRLVNNNYRQLFLTLAHSKSYENITAIFIEIDFDDVNHITKTCNRIKESLDSWNSSSKH